jgi:hypothetical protein
MHFRRPVRAISKLAIVQEDACGRERYSWKIDNGNRPAIDFIAFQSQARL